MILSFSKQFKKDFIKLTPKIKAQFQDRLNIFQENQNSPQLNNHKLHGSYDGFYSINISGNIRAIYEQLGKDKVLFIKIGTHSQLY
jgi:addiction module RelE/StbE family toxin